MLSFFIVSLLELSNSDGSVCVEIGGGLAQYSADDCLRDQAIVTLILMVMQESNIFSSYYMCFRSQVLKKKVRE